MIKRNLPSLLIITAMILNILNFDFSAELKSKTFLLFSASIVIMIFAIVLIIKKESKV
jgi:hypothetical protein